MRKFFAATLLSVTVAGSAVFGAQAAGSISLVPAEEKVQLSLVDDSDDNNTTELRFVNLEAKESKPVYYYVSPTKLTWDNILGSRQNTFKIKLKKKNPGTITIKRIQNDNKPKIKISLVKDNGNSEVFLVDDEQEFQSLKFKLIG